MAAAPGQPVAERRPSRGRFRKRRTDSSPTAKSSQAVAATKAATGIGSPNPPLLPPRARRRGPRRARRRRQERRAYRRRRAAERRRGRGRRARATPIALIARIGKTQGIRLRIRPPRKAKAKVAMSRSTAIARRRRDGAFRRVAALPDFCRGVALPTCGCSGDRQIAFAPRSVLQRQDAGERPAWDRKPGPI